MKSKARKSTTLPRSALLAELEKLPLNARIDENYIAAARNCSIATVRRDRTMGGGVPFISEGGEVATITEGVQAGQSRRFGSRVHYLKSDLVKFLETRNQTFANTTEADQHQQSKADRLAQNKSLPPCESSGQ